MKVLIDKSFDKDVKKVKSKKVLEKLAEVIEQVKESNSVDNLKGLKKLRGHNYYYRIRMGNYRIGVSINNATIEFIRFLPRKDIYKLFP